MVSKAVARLNKTMKVRNMSGHLSGRLSEGAGPNEQGSERSSLGPLMMRRETLSKLAPSAMPAGCETLATIAIPNVPVVKTIIDPNTTPRSTQQWAETIEET
jgi:hypothetical protein